MTKKEVLKELLERCTQDGEFWKSGTERALMSSISELTPSMGAEAAMDFVIGIFQVAAWEFGG